jgi:hypothetical protein
VSTLNVRGKEKRRSAACRARTTGRRRTCARARSDHRPDGVGIRGTRWQ